LEIDVYMQLNIPSYSIWLRQDTTYILCSLYSFKYEI